jgi:hypothetical protein
MMSTYGKNLETCPECRAVAHLFSLEELILVRDEKPNFNHVHQEAGKLVAFSAEQRAQKAEKPPAGICYACKQPLDAPDAPHESDQDCIGALRQALQAELLRSQGLEKHIQDLTAEIHAWIEDVEKQKGLVQAMKPVVEAAADVSLEVLKKGRGMEAAMVVLINKTKLYSEKMHPERPPGAPPICMAQTGCMGGICGKLLPCEDHR